MQQYPGFFLGTRESESFQKLGLGDNNEWHKVLKACP